MDSACRISLSRNLRATVLGLLSIVSLYAQSPAQKKFIISVGSPSKKVAAGTIWLYGNSWYGLQKFQLATIRNGVASLWLDADKLRQEVKPHPDTDGFILAVQIGEHEWYRSPDIIPNVFWSDLPSAVTSLGTATKSSTGEIQIVLASPAKRHITLLYPSGRAAANSEINLSIYLWDTNHCAVHEGLPLGTFHTDKTGTIEVSTPRVALYLDGIEYYEKVGKGPVGVAYSDNLGLKTGPEENLVLTEQWNLTDDDELSEDAELRVLGTNGKPRAGVDIYATLMTNTCNGGDSIGRTDAKGDAQIVLKPSISSLQLMVGGPYSAGDPQAVGKSRDLNNSELQQLFAKHQLTIRW